MNRISHLLFACVLLTALLPWGARCDGEDKPEVRFEDVVPECFKEFQATAARAPNNVKLVISNQNQFGAPRPIGKHELQFYNNRVIGQIYLTNSGLSTKITRRFKLKGFFAFENVLQFSLVGEVDRAKVIDKCETAARDLAEFLEPRAKYKVADVVDKFKAKFEELFGADKKIELLEVPMEQEAKAEQTEAQGETQAQRGLALFETTKSVKTSARSLAGGKKMDRWVFKLVSSSKKLLGQVDFVQASAWNMVVTVKVNNQFAAKTFLSFMEPLNKAIVTVDGILQQMKDIEVADDLQSADMEALITKVMASANCVDPAPTFTSAENYSVTSWIRGQKVEVIDQSEMEGFRDRRLAGEECPFDVLTVAFDRIWIDGFPSLQVFFEGNTKFTIPIYLDYFLTVKNKEQIEARVQKLFSKFVATFRVSEAARKVKEKIDNDYDAAFTEYKAKVLEDAPGVELLKEPTKPEEVKWTVQQTAQAVQKKIMDAHAKSGGKLNLLFMMNPPGADKTETYLVKDGAKTLMILDLLPLDHPRAKITFFFYPDDKGERSSTYQVDVSSDPRLGQVEMLQGEFDKYFAAAWKRTRRVVV